MSFPFVSGIPEAASFAGRADRAVWTGQNGNGIPNDCGPAVIKGFLTWLGRAPALTVADIAMVIDRPTFNGTTASECGEYLRRQGLTPVYGAACNIAPFVALVDYARLPLANRLDQTGRTFKHWITVTAIGADGVTYNDPYHPDAAHGANLRMTAGQFAYAEAGIWYRWSIKERPAVTPPTDGVGSGADEVVEQVEIQPESNVRASKTTRITTNILGESAKTWLKVDAVLEPALVEGFAWWRVALQPVWPAGLFALEKTKPDTKVAYVRADRVRKSVPVTPPVVTPPTPTPDPVAPAKIDARYLLGVNCLNDHPAGREALKAGARCVLFMDGLMAAADAARAYPDAVIAARFWFQNRPEAAFLADHMGRTLRDLPANLITTIANEADWGGYGTPQEVASRFSYEREVCERIWASNPGRIMVIGEFSHGTPDITRADIKQAMRDTYGQFAIANKHRVRVGWHLYTYGRRFTHHPGVNQSIVAPEWFEGRDASFYSDWGAPSGVKFFCGETGVESGQGGFIQPGYSSEQFAEWCAWWLAYRATLKVDMVGACLFQFGNHPGWQGYNVQHHAGTLAEFWSGKRGAAPRIARTLESGFTEGIYNAPPENYAPARKEME